MSFSSYYYPTEYCTTLSLTCENCETEFEKEVNVKGNWYETNCPKCNKSVEGEAE